jgi:hypothetical protein
MVKILSRARTQLKYPSMQIGEQFGTQSAQARTFHTVNEPIVAARTQKRHPVNLPKVSAPCTRRFIEATQPAAKMAKDSCSLAVCANAHYLGLSKPCAMASIGKIWAHSIGFVRFR